MTRTPLTYIAAGALTARCLVVIPQQRLRHDAIGAIVDRHVRAGVRERALDRAAHGLPGVVGRNVCARGGLEVPGVVIRPHIFREKADDKQRPRQRDEPAQGEEHLAVTHDVIVEMVYFSRY